MDLRVQHKICKFIRAAFLQIALFLKAVQGIILQQAQLEFLQLQVQCSVSREPTE